jgi:hypothetical protein
MPVNQNLKEYSKKIGDEIKKFNEINIFERSGLSNLIEQINNIGRSSDGSFELIIPREKPLVINKVDHEIISGIEISCNLKGKIADEGDIVFSEYSFEVTLWSDKPDQCYRKKLDAEEIGSRIQNGELVKRIFLRYHFDMKNESTLKMEPLFHFHIGGDLVDEESLMWHPKGLSEPRIPYPPMDPFLVIDLTLRNFCGKSAYHIFQRSQWTTNVDICHGLFQKRFNQLLLQQSFA